MKFKYSTEYRIASDYDLTARIYFSGYTDYLRFDFPVCKFYLGGESTSNRKLLLKEGYLIHRKVVKNNITVAKIKLIKRALTFFIIDKFPRVYWLLRSIGSATSSNQK